MTKKSRSLHTERALLRQPDNQLAKNSIDPATRFGVRERLLQARIFLLIALFLNAWPEGWAADRKEPPTVKAPPQPVAAAIQVHRGKSIEIPLRIYGSRSQTLEFRIRKDPQSGQLSEIQQVEPEAATVLYTPPADLQITQDRFAYAVRSREGVSAPAEIQIIILDDPPQLVAPAELSSTPILLGESANLSLEIRNQGGGLATGELQPPPPWSVLGSPLYQLPAGKTQRFNLRFTPTQAGNFEGTLRYSSQPDRATALQGQALPPIGLSPPKLQLQPLPESSVRTGVLVLTNHTTEERTFDLSGPDRLRFARHQKLAPGQVQQVVIQTEPSDVAPLEGSITFEQASVQVTAEPSPAFLSPQPATLTFGPAKPGSVLRQTVTLSNLGGTVANANLRIAPPFRIRTPSLSIPPGEKLNLEIEYAPTSREQAQADLTVQSVSRTLQIPLSAPAWAALSDSRTGKSSSPHLFEDSPPEESSTLFLPFNSHFPPVLAELTQTSAQVRCPTSSQRPPQYKAQIRQLSLQSGKLNVVWIDYPECSFDPTPHEIVATFSNLSPQTFYFLRILGLDNSGNPDGLPWEITFQTKALPSLPLSTSLPYLTLALLSASLVVGYWLRFTRSRRP